MRLLALLLAACTHAAPVREPRSSVDPGACFRLEVRYQDRVELGLVCVDSVTMRVQYQGTWYSTSDGRQFCSPACEAGYMWRRYQYVRLKGGGWGRWQAAEDWNEGPERE